MKRKTISWRAFVFGTVVGSATVLLLTCNKAGATDFTEVVLDDEGCPFKNEFTTLRTSATVAGPDCPKNDKPDLTLGDIVYISCNFSTGVEQPPPTGEEKFVRNELAKRVRRAKDERLSLDEIKLVKKLVGLLWSPAVVGVVYPRIDPTLAKKPDEKK